MRESSITVSSDWGGLPGKGWGTPKPANQDLQNEMQQYNIVKARAQLCLRCLWEVAVAQAKLGRHGMKRCLGWSTCTVGPLLINSATKTQEGCLPRTALVVCLHPLLRCTDTFCSLLRSSALQGSGEAERRGTTNLAVAWCKSVKVLRSREGFGKDGRVAS